MCGHFVPKKGQQGEGVVLSDLFVEMYEKYYADERVIRNATWVPDHCCKSCYSALHRWWNQAGDGLRMPYGKPMLWSLVDPGEHNDKQCYGCVNYVSGMKKSDKHRVYVAAGNVQLPVSHEGIPVPKKNTPDFFSLPTTDPQSDFSADIGSIYLPPTTSTQAKEPDRINKDELDSLVVDLDLGKIKSEKLASFLKRKNLLVPGVKVSSFRHRDADFKQCFVVNEEKDFVYCYDIERLMAKMGIEYNADDWRLFIDSSKNSLKAVLLHYTNKQPSVPIAYSTKTKEDYEKMKVILDLVRYKKHEWRICCDLKVVALLVGLQGGYTKHMCFLCNWDSRYEYADKRQQYKKKDWEQRPPFPTIGKLNQINEPLVESNKILLPYLHIKLGIVKSFIKTIVTRPEVFQCLKKIFPGLSDDKIKSGNSKPKYSANSNRDSIFFYVLIRCSRWPRYKKIDEKIIVSI